MQHGVKVRFATIVSTSKGGQFILHAKTLPGNLYEGRARSRMLIGELRSLHSDRRFQELSAPISVEAPRRLTVAFRQRHGRLYSRDPASPYEANGYAGRAWTYFVPSEIFLTL